MNFYNQDCQEYFDPLLVRRVFIVNGGQTGVDRAALDVAQKLRLPSAGWCPRNRVAEDGAIPFSYPMAETTSEDPSLRTELNVIDSDGTLVLSIGVPKDGTNLTIDACKLHERPYLYGDLDLELGSKAYQDFKQKFHIWLADQNIRILNIAGPRESHKPGFIYSKSYAMILDLLKAS